MNIGNKKWAGKTAALSLSALLAASVVAGCGNKATGDATSGASGASGTNTSGTGASATNFSGSDVVATVNGENITRGDLYPLMVASSGESLLTSLIGYQMLMQELKKSGLSVSEAEIDAFLQSRGEQNAAQKAQIDELTKTGGGKLDAVRRQVRSQLAIEKLVTKDIKADPAAVKTWFDKNQNLYATPAKVKVGLLLAGTKVRADTMLAQLKAKSKTFQQLVDDQKNSTDPTGKQSTTETPEVPADTLNQSLGPVVGAAAQKLALGGSSPVLSLGQGAFGIISILSKSGGGKPDFNKLQATVETDYKLEQVARAQVSKNGNKQPFEQALKQVETAVQQQNSQQGNFAKPSYHDLLGLMAQAKVQEMQTKMRETAKVEVTDPDLKKVGDEFKPVASSATAPGATTPGAPAAGAPAAGATAPNATAPSAASSEPHDPNSPTHTPH